jgi:hypothetical protein
MKPTVYYSSLVLAGAVAMTGGCASHDPAAPSTNGVEGDRVIAAQAGAEIALAPGEAAKVASANLHVRFNRVIGDSRCPNDPAVQCVWGGSVIIEIQAGPILGYQYIDVKRLETLPGKDTVTVAGSQIRLLRVTPERRSTAEIPAQSYRIVLQVGSPK